MKLISLYIENFGGLSRYSLDFSQGLTVIEEPNGFGKSTLAEFIRAMFYGFPRKAKTLDKSRRQKYTPWQGGVFGGNLVFSFEGTRYRIERTFGATPKGDSFTLMDLDTGRKSDRFSEEIGLELFRLDAESFERSTYLPQLHDTGCLTTNSIQAKLADLVEDPADVGNFDKAVAALRSARSGFIPYRGSGGSVAQARSNISRLQTQLEQCAPLEQSREEIRNELARLEDTQGQLEHEKKDVRRRLDLAVEADSIAALQEQYARLSREQAEICVRIEDLERHYPRGLPSEEALREIRLIAADRAVLSAQTVTTREDGESLRFCQENEGRFGTHTPSREELEACRRDISEYQTLRAEADATGLTESEQQQYAALLARQKAGEFDPDRLARLEETNRKLGAKRHEQTQLTFSGAGTLEELDRYFSPGIPEDAHIAEHRQTLAQPTPRAPAMAAVIFLALLVAAGIGAGVWLILTGLALYGALALAAAAGLLIPVPVLLRKRKAARAAADAQRQATEFARRYTETQPTAEALYEIRDKLDDYRRLQDERTAFEGRKANLLAGIAALEETLSGELPEADGDFDRAILALHLAGSQFADLQAQLEQAERKRQALETAIRSRRERVTAFLAPYFPEIDSARFHELLSSLQRDSEQYLRCQDQVSQWQTRKALHESRLAELEGKLAEFFTAFSLERALDLDEQLQQLRDDANALEDALHEQAQLNRELEAFARTHEAALATVLPEKREQVEQLRDREQQISEQLSDTASRVLTLRDRQRRVAQQLQEMPALAAELEQWQESCSADREKAEILDSAMEFLEKARDNLQNNYLGPVRAGFERYMQLLPGEESRNILLSPDLEVQLERFGKARELGYFSAGQTDMVMLCMRLALVDALFPETKPFVILDDPFVNLDDAHTAQALQLLKELAEHTQILYLVCNSSRSI